MSNGDGRGGDMPLSCLALSTLSLRGSRGSRVVASCNGELEPIKLELQSTIRGFT